MSELTTAELVDLVRRVFKPGVEDRTIGILVDLPDDHVPDHPGWATRRAVAASWRARLAEGGGEIGLERVDSIYYRNARRNNGELPEQATIQSANTAPNHVDGLVGPSTPFAEIFDTYRLLIAPTEFSATAPLKLAAPEHGFRAATLPGFSPAMVPALKLDYDEIGRQCDALKARLDPARSARLRFEADGREQTLELDLRHRLATASGGRLHEPGTAGNLPAGETYIVPYEGERPGDPSLSRGTLPLELDGELLYYRIENNRAVAVQGDGPRAAVERHEIEDEPAYANLAELGLGVLAGYGVRPIGEILIDEKLGLHIAFGRSDHFGGHVGAEDFSAADRVVHIDRVYLPETQPRIRIARIELELPDRIDLLMRDGAYV